MGRANMQVDGRVDQGAKNMNRGTTVEAVDLYAPVRARVHPGAITRVTRFFTAGLEDIFSELFQNSRRSAASIIEISTTTEEDGITVSVSDDGEGIRHPEVLLSFGQSDWKSRRAREEDPAGMGVYALSKRGCTVHSRRNGENGWVIALATGCFTGEHDAQALFDESAPTPNGTRIEFVAKESMSKIAANALGCARHTPIKVTLNGETLRRESFLKKCSYTEEWEGVTIGVTNEQYRSPSKPDLNFYGITLNARLPHIATPDRKQWCAYANIKHCAKLELVLPQRKEIVENAFTEALRNACKEAIYRAMAAAPQAVAVSFKDWREANDLGIKIREAPAMLRTWKPEPPRDEYEGTPDPEAIRSTTRLAWPQCERPDQHVLNRAINGEDEKHTLMEREPAYAGFAWYDAIGSIESMATFVVENGERKGIAESDAGRYGTRPERVEIELKIRGEGGSRTEEVIQTDVAFSGDPSCAADGTEPIVTATSEISPWELSELMRLAFCSFSDDACDDSWKTQREGFQKIAEYEATKLLKSDDEAICQALKAAVYEHLQWVIPAGRQAVMVVGRGDVTVRIETEEPHETTPDTRAQESGKRIR